MVHSEARRKGVSEVTGIDRHRLGWGEEKGGRGSDGFRVGFGFWWRGVEWSEWVEWIRVEWSGAEE